jgi:lipoprotein NlpI
MIFSIFIENTRHEGFLKIEEILKDNFVDIFDIIKNLYKFSQERCDKLLKIANENLQTDITENVQNDVKIENSTLILSIQEPKIDKSQTSENIKEDFDKTEEEKSCNKNILDYEFVATY